jgi:hypothetical protein
MYKCGRKVYSLLDVDLCKPWVQQQKCMWLAEQHWNNAYHHTSSVQGDTASHKVWCAFCIFKCMDAWMNINIKWIPWSHGAWMVYCFIPRYHHLTFPWLFCIFNLLRQIKSTILLSLFRKNILSSRDTNKLFPAAPPCACRAQMIEIGLFAQQWNNKGCLIVTVEQKCVMNCYDLAAGGTIGWTS